MSMFALMALLGVGLFATVLGGSDDAEADGTPQDDDVPQEPEAPPVEPTNPIDPIDPPETITEGQEISYGEEPVVTGTNGNDTLVADLLDVEDVAPLIVVNLGDGDDVADDIAGIPGELTVNGEAGNDTLDAAGAFFIDLNGGAGDDVLHPAFLATATGGDGDDTFEAQLYDGFNNGGVELLGNAGDDTFDVTAPIGYAKTLVDIGDLKGGAGQDTFNLSLNLTYDPYWGGEASPDLETESATGVVLDDFDRTEDTLMIEIETLEGSEGRDLTSVDVTDTTIVLSFAASDTIGAHTATIALGDSANITAQDITVLMDGVLFVPGEALVQGP